MDKKPVPLIAFQHKVASWRFVVCLGEVIVVALREILENVAENDFLPKDVPKTLNSDLRSIFDTKALFSEAIKSLDLYGNYLKRPGEKTAKWLKDSLEHRKISDNEHHSQDEINEFVDIFRTYLNQKHSDYFDYEYDNYDKKSKNFANQNLDYDFGVESQPRSISPDGNKFDHSSSHDSYENSFKNENMNGNESNGEKESNSSVQNNEHNGELKFSSAELQRQPQKIKLGQVKNSKIRKKDEYCSHKHKINESSNMKDEDSSFAIIGKQKEHVGKDRGYSGEETMLCHEKIMREKASKSGEESMKSVGKKNREDENNYLKEKLKLLEIKYKELLADFGESSVRKMAKEKKERKTELFRQMNFSHQPENKQSFATLRNKNPSYEPGEIIEDKELDHQAISKSDDHQQVDLSLPGSIVSGQFRFDGAWSSRTGANVNFIEKEIPAVQSLSKNKTSSKEELKQSTTVINRASVMASTGRDGNNHDSLIEQSYETLPYSVQQDYSNAPEYISLKHIPPTSVAASLYNNYIFLLLSLAQNLLFSDVVKLKVWAAQRFSISNPQNATDVLIKLDQKGFIHASDLSQLRDFFESILRIDLVCVIDAFLLGDYSLFRELSACKKLDVNRAQTQQNTANSRYQNIWSSVPNPSESSFKSLTSASSISSRNGEKSLSTSTGPISKNESMLPTTNQAATPNSSDKSKPMLVATSSGVNQTFKIREQSLRAFGSSPPAEVTDTAVADSSVLSESRTATSYSTTRTNLQTNKTRSAAKVASNGSKLSKFQSPDSVYNVQSSGTSRNNAMSLDDNWLCSHYKRHCYVKFECCDKFWPCHRCHNNQSSCGRRKLKSRDTKMLKCVYCDKVQQFGQFCDECRAKFADYHCGLCKHLTGRDDHPYHCEKCGICRIHGDRSFHCDVCGVCLDVQLRGNHKCRAGSAHDECCICLEDAFTGCQILPCSHKVHKECATQMIRSGITRCPICRESFAHKLERRPTDSGKRSGFGK